MERGDRSDKILLARNMARSWGVDLVEVRPATDGASLVALGFGTGIVLAACDHLAEQYPEMGLWAADLPGSIGLDARVTVMDYLGTALPSLWLMWCGISPATEYVRRLRERAFHPRATWLYLRGLGEERTSDWTNMGVRLVEDLWSREPLGNWQFVRSIITR